MTLVATQVKRRRGTTAENDAFTGAEGEITVDTEKHELRVHDGMTQGGFKIGGGSGSGRNIGDIFMTKRTDSGLSGAVECNGGTYNTTDYDGDGSIGELLEAGKLDYISLTDYATAISTKGWCDKIGWNGAGTTSFRVPTLTPRIIQTNNIPVIGNGMTLGLTDGTNLSGLQLGNYTSGTNHQSQITIANSKYGSTVGTHFDSNPLGTEKTIGVTTDGTKSGIIADTSDTAQLRVMIQLTGGATDEAFATCSEVLADVAGLKDMDNITSTGKETIVGWGMPDYTTTITTSLNSFNSSSNYWTVPYDCQCVIGSDTYADNDKYYSVKLSEDGQNWIQMNYDRDAGWSGLGQITLFLRAGIKIYVLKQNADVKAIYSKLFGEV